VAAGGPPAGLRRALLGYRVMAYLVGVALLVLVLIGVPLQLAGHPVVVRVAGPIHGALYLGYLAAAAHLARRASLPITDLGWAILAGLVPGLVFLVERRLVRRILEEQRTKG
jgi:integral membrane protein